MSETVSRMYICKKVIVYIMTNQMCITNTLRSYPDAWLKFRNMKNRFEVRPGIRPPMVSVCIHLFFACTVCIKLFQECTYMKEIDFFFLHSNEPYTLMCILKGRFSSGRFSSGWSVCVYIWFLLVRFVLNWFKNGYMRETDIFFTF